MSFTTLLLQFQREPTPEAWKVIQDGALLLRGSAADSFGCLTGMGPGAARAQLGEPQREVPE